MLVTIIGQILALGFAALVGLLLHRIIRLEKTLACVLVGFLAGLSIEYIHFDTGIRASNLKDIVFFIILPVLIFEASWHIKPRMLKRWLMPTLILATVGVVIGTLITALLTYLGQGNPEHFPWIAALLTGALLAATDPIAVISQLKTAGAPSDLTMLFEGESLFNDATVIVLFTIIMGFATHSAGEHDTHYFQLFSLVFLGGIAIGIIAGLISAIVILFVKHPATTNFIMILTAFGSFYFAEHVLHMSGIMAVMMSAIILRTLLSEVETIVAKSVADTWEWLGQAFNSVLFVIMGLVITINMFIDQWLAMIIAIAASLVARAIVVLACAWLAKPFKPSIPQSWQILLFWGGLKGAIAIALVLSLPVELPYWWTIQSMVFGVVVFSLLIQGPINGPLIKRYAKEIE